MTLSLYFAPNTCALVPLISLHEAGASFTLKPVDFRRGQNKSADYLAINRLHKVPVLMIEGTILTENVAINLWIAQNYPHAKLLPADAGQLLQAISMMSWFAAGIHPHISRYNSPPKFCDAPESGPAMRRIAQEMIFENFQHAETLLTGREFFFDHFTAVDAHFFWCLRRGHQLELDLKRFAHCEDFFNRLAQRPSIRKALASENEIKEQFARETKSL